MKRDIKTNPRRSPEEIGRQYEYMARVADFNAVFGGAPAKKCYVETYGCQQNEADSELIRGMAVKMGYAVCAGPEDADLIVFNTCAIREHAEQRVYGNIGALRKYKLAKPGLMIALCGCMAGEDATEKRIKKSYPYVSMVVNTHELWRFPELLYGALVNGCRVFATEDSPGSIAEGLPAHRSDPVRGWLPIMYGCDNFCTYCIVPYVRGRERSRGRDEVVRAAEELISSGRRDITLLGQNVNSYNDGSGTDFPDLIRSINGLPGEFWIRFMTSHPKDAGEKLFRAMRDCEKAAGHLHLPFQSGSDRILKRMNRGYTAGHYRELIAQARELMPGLVITSDVIVGFPGESEEDFEQTMELIRELRFDALFTFLFSPRAGTAAADFEDTTPREEKNARFDALVTLQNAISSEIHGEYLGTVQTVLVDGRAENKPEGWLSSRTGGGRLTVFKGDPGLVGNFARVKITGSTTWSLAGELTE